MCHPPRPVNLRSRNSKRVANLLVALSVIAAGEAVADPPGAPGPGTQVTWRILENRGTDSATFSSRFELVARARDGATQRLGPFRLPCYLSRDGGVLTCSYGGAFDYLRVRRAGRACVIEAQRSTEHGMGARRVLGRFRCSAPVVETAARTEVTQAFALRSARAATEDRARRGHRRRARSHRDRRLDRRSVACC